MTIQAKDTGVWTSPVPRSLHWVVQDEFGLPGLSRCANTGMALGKREDTLEIVLFIMPAVGEYSVPGAAKGLEECGQKASRLAWSPISVQQAASADPGGPLGSGAPGSQSWLVPGSTCQPGPRPKLLTDRETRSTGGRDMLKVTCKSGWPWVLGHSSQQGLPRVSWSLEDLAAPSKTTRSNRSNAGAAIRFSFWGL